METKKVNQYLTLLSENETLTLDALDGTATLAGATDVFQAYIDPDLKYWGTDTPGIATKEQEVDVYKLLENGTFAQMFGSFGIDLDALCVTQSQIQNFCTKHPQWLCQNSYSTFFLFKVEDQFFVAYVYLHSNGLLLRVFQFERDYLWRARDSIRVIVPRLDA